MSTPRLKRRNGAVVDTALIDEFQKDFLGRVILPAHAGYDMGDGF